MPELLRLGVLAESLLVAAWQRRAGNRPRRRCSTPWSGAPIGLLQQYPRLFRSLVLFGDLELAAPAQ